ncbi:MAG: MnhB domain-containing protein [Lautropia sp.]|nr:MnhB domain-containing protein [Lautropia sp.]
MRLGDRVVMLEVAARPLYWLILAVSVWVLLRGHNEPGGGFIAGLLATSATVLWGFAHGGKSAARRLPWGSPQRLAAFGVLVAALSGLPALWLGGPFLQHLWWDLPLGVTTLPVSTVLLFDLGVYFCVWGGIAGYALAMLGLDREERA